MSDMETVPIVLCTDDNYLPFMSVTMQSVMENAGKGNYKFFIFYKEINPSSVEILKKQVGKFDQFSISFINVAEYFAGRNFNPGGIRTVEALFRLAAPYVLTDYKKILYFDCDITCRVDVRKLYDIDIGDNLVGAAPYLNMFQYKYKDIPPDCNKLNLKHPEKTFNSGVLIMNAEQFRKTVKFEYMLDLSNRNRAILGSSNDEDVLNVLCEDRTLYLPYHWNYVITYQYHALPEPLKQQHIEYKKNPSFIHFQPWTHIIRCEYAHYFWGYASHTPFYAEIKMRQRKNFKKNFKKYFKQAVRYLRYDGIKPLILILKDAVRKNLP
jgi:lipopolysaccharide biosynthesis glycosyltransferase